ncbi:MAG: metallophosphoesterase [Acidobacteria bacterium]|nr:metallophosphoesterase [Acidobacteriota bacterium]
MMVALALALVPTSQGLAETIRFAVIGDYGSTAQSQSDGQDEKQVAEMVKGWKPSFIITVGDNNYECGDASTIVENIGNYYCDFIFNPGAPAGQLCTGRAADDKTNYFFPSLGNHDWYTPDAKPYLAYFTQLPGNKRYYDFVQGPIHIFALDSESKETCNSAADEEEGKPNKCNQPCTYEPDGGDKNSKQAQWLKDKLTGSQSPWKLAFFHRPPYSCKAKTTAEWMRWPFEKWGLSAVLSGHRHVYERIVRKKSPNFPYFINGVGGTELSKCKNKDEEQNLPPSKFDAISIDGQHGAMLVEASEDQINFQFYVIAAKGNKVKDTCRLTKTKHGQSLTCSQVNN